MIILDILEPEARKKLPDLRPGDKIRVHQKIKEGGKEKVSIFEGRVIAIKGGKGFDGTFTVRRIAAGVGVEKTFPWYLPSIIKIERLKRAKVKRAKLYYLRGFRAKKLKRLKEKKATGVWEGMVPETPNEEPEEKKPEEKEKIEGETKEKDSAKEPGEAGKKNESKEGNGQSS